MKMRERFFIVMVFATLCSVEAYAADAANGLATTGYVRAAVADGVADKADKSTTLAGYGIGDAYTKGQVDSALSGKLSTSGTAAKATADADGNNIAGTYATKSELSGKQATLTTGENGNIKGTGSVTVSKDASGVITVNGTSTQYTLPAATDTVRGGVMVDTALSDTSTNPVQNKVVKDALDGKQASLGYTAENIANKTATIAAAASANDTKYPTEKAVRTELDTKADKTAIPTVNNATLTIQQNGASVGTFTANQATNATVNVTVPTKVSQLTNDSSFATTGDLASKQDTANLAAASDIDVGAMTNADKLKKYPSVALMEGYVSGQIQSSTSSLGDLSSKNSISTDDIEDKAVTNAKLSDAVNASLTKADTALQSVSGGAAVSGKVATAVVKNGTAVSVTMDYVKIPVGSATAPTGVAQIWIQ